MYADYSYYQETFGGTMPEAAYAAAERKAEACISYLTYLNGDKIPFDCILVDIADCFYITSSYPKMSIVLPTQLRMPVNQHKCTFSLQPRHSTRYAQLRWNWGVEVYMVLTHCPFQNLYSLHLTNIPDHFNHIFSHLSVHRFSKVFRYKNNVIREIILGM